MSKGTEIANQNIGFLRRNRTGMVTVQNDDTRSWTRSEATEGGAIRYNYGIAFALTGRARNVKIIIALEPDDTYTVYVWRMRERGDTRPIIGEVLERHDGLYWDMMPELLQALYDEYVYGTKRSSRWMPEYSLQAA